jgi:hypothetical protein
VLLCWNTYNWRYIYSIALAGGYGFVTAGLQGLTILDLAQPDDLVTANVYGNTGRVYGLAKDGNWLYAATDRLSIIDVSESADPYLTWVTNALGFAKYVGVRSGYAYLGADNNTAVYIVDVHDPVSPTHITSPAISGSMWAINFPGVAG